ncbi:MAG TPA: DUF1343 domain-containing protein, partial [Candidatus Omnitrophica bacterium]|nr:DUF1343 domain-containing protein [Candidatus Omnitrophota bacterium]
MGFLKLTSIVIASILFAMSVTPASYGGVKLGIEVLLESPSYQKMLEGKRLGLITNPTGVDSKFNSTIELLYEHPKLNLCALFAPEHGLRGERSAGEWVQQSIDKKTQLPVYSLYGKSKKPTGKMLEKIDVLIFDIQDIGVRTYTYISTLFLIMEAADGEGKEVFVLDRPNPLGGVNVEGPVLKPEYKSFIGMLEIPLIHGMTIGEIAMLIKGENKMKLKLTVVPMEGWRRDMVWEDTGLFWVPTSPHIPTPTSAFLYATTGTIGSRNLSNGVGYTLPFQLIGSEWISPFEFIEKLNSKNIPGVRFQSCWFKPFYSIFKDKTLKGVRFILTDSKSFKPVRTALEILTTLESLYPGIYEPPQDFNKIWGVDYILTEIKKRK